MGGESVAAISCFVTFDFYVMVWSPVRRTDTASVVKATVDSVGPQQNALTFSLNC